MSRFERTAQIQVDLRELSRFSFGMSSFLNRLLTTSAQMCTVTHGGHSGSDLTPTPSRPRVKDTLEADQLSSSPTHPASIGSRWSHA